MSDESKETQEGVNDQQSGTPSTTDEILADIRLALVGPAPLDPEQQKQADKLKREQAAAAALEERNAQTIFAGTETTAEFAQLRAVYDSTHLGPQPIEHYAYEDDEFNATGFI